MDVLICGFLILAGAMYSRIIFQRVFPFGIAFLFAIAFVNFFSALVTSEKSPLTLNAPGEILLNHGGSGVSGADHGSNVWDDTPELLTPNANSASSKMLKILSKPAPKYSDVGRANMVQGTVVLRVVFLASGNIGSIEVVKGLPDGLSEEAIKAARRIEFEPAWKYGGSFSVIKQVEYTFTIY